ncbi:MAG: methyltransferase [Saprospiraceae bacterium]|nr:methyltransferase [Saprospiraceae bacterium]
MNNTEAKPFKFKQFEINQDKCTMKIGTDGVLLGAWVNVTGAKKILDVGTGSGVIGIMLGQRNTDAMIHGVEIDGDSYEQTKENMGACPWADRLEAFNMPIQDFAKVSREKYDLIVSNPPFFSGGTFSTNENRSMVRHTVKLPHGDLLAAVRSLLSEEGRFAVILPLIEGLRFQEISESYHLYCQRITEVQPKADKPVERLLMEFGREQQEVVKDKLVIQHDGRNEWTDSYIELTKDFYLKM